MSPPPTAATRPRPAIVLITCDELRADALSCYGNRAVATPHLDRLAQQGVRFARAYTASPWCLPSRASILTGLYPHQHQAYSNFRNCRLDPARPNLYHALRAQGYRTAHVGKCHYAPVPYGETRPDRTLPYDAMSAYYLSLGIDHLDLQDDKQVSVWFYDDYARDLDGAGYLAAYRAAVWDRAAAKVFEFPGPAEWHPDAWVGRKAVERIAAAPDDSPLFVWVSFSGPHFPFDAPAEYQARVNEEHVGLGTFQAGEFDDPGRIHHYSYHGGGGIEGAGSAPDRACKQLLDASSLHHKAGDAVTREHDAQPPGVQVECIGVGPSRERVVDEHDRPLQPLKPVGRLHEHIRQAARQALAHGVHLGDVRAHHADHGSGERPLSRARAIAVVAHHDGALQQSFGEGLVHLAGNEWRQFHRHQTGAALGQRDRVVEAGRLERSRSAAWRAAPARRRGSWLGRGGRDRTPAARSVPCRAPACVTRAAPTAPDRGSGRRARWGRPRAAPRDRSATAPSRT